MALQRSVYQSSTSEERSNPQGGRWKPSVSAPLCAFCNKTVYPAEEIMGAGQRFHKMCLKCTSCKTILNPGSLNEREKKIYCVPCYRRHFAPRAVGHGLATSYVENPSTNYDSNQEETDYNSYDQTPLSNSLDDDYRQSKSMTYASEVTKRTTASMTHRPTSVNVSSGGTGFKASSVGGNVCCRCSKTVYSAEEVKAAGKSYHKQCYRCAHCQGAISGGRYSIHDDQLYDNNCYQRLFGPRGVGFGMGAGTLSTGN